MRIGIECEYWVIDGTGSLSGPGRAADGAEFVDREALPSLVEVKTDPHGSIAELRAELFDRLRRLRRRLAADGKRLAPLGTTLVAPRAEPRDSPRIDAQRRVLGDAFADVIACAGTHVHFEQVAPAAQLNALTALDPAFALVSTAAHHRGERVGACARPLAYRRRGYAAHPELGQLRPYAADAAEWRRRLRERAERFREAARRAGVPDDAIDEFDPPTSVWGPVRLRDDLGTVEWRAPDAAPPGEALQLVADVARVVQRAVDRGVTLDAAAPGVGGALRCPPFDRLRTITDDAMRNGCASGRVREYLAAFGIDPDDYRRDHSRGTAARLSRADARELRRRSAERLDRVLARRVGRRPAEPAAGQ